MSYSASESEHSFSSSDEEEVIVSEYEEEEYDEEVAAAPSSRGLFGCCAARPQLDSSDAISDPSSSSSDESESESDAATRAAAAASTEQAAADDAQVPAPVASPRTESDADADAVTDEVEDDGNDDDDDDDAGRAPARAPRGFSVFFCCRRPAVAATGEEVVVDIPSAGSLIDGTFKKDSVVEREATGAAASDARAPQLAADADADAADAEADADAADAAVGFCSRVFCCRRAYPAKTELALSTPEPAAGDAAAPKAEPSLQREPSIAKVRKVVHQEQVAAAATEAKQQIAAEERKLAQNIIEFDATDGELNEEQKFAFFTSQFPDASEETRRRWSTVVGCYLVFTPGLNTFAIQWSAKPVANAIGFFSCDSSLMPMNKLRTGDKDIINQKGKMSAVCRAAWLTFAKYAARYDGEITFLTSPVWRQALFGNIELVVLDKQGRIVIIRRCERPYILDSPIAVAAVENSFRFQSRRRNASATWTLSTFAITVKSLSQALYTEIDNSLRVAKRVT